MNCRTCKHWGPNTAAKPVSLPPDVGFACHRIASGSWGDCTQNGAVMEEPISNEKPTLITGPDFGCTLYEPMP